ncbi:MAG: hypothetical protein IIB53_12320 [Planctomycetes bacterium]|nr:hypothetical protein [Planctomycetota bacterium]
MSDRDWPRGVSQGWTTTYRMEIAKIYSPSENARSVTTPEERKQPGRDPVTIQDACRKYAEIRDLFVRIVTHTLSTNDVYQLDGYFGTLGRNISTIIVDYVDRIVDLRKAEGRINVALQRYNVHLGFPPMTAPQHVSRGVLRRYGGELSDLVVQFGPSPFVQQVAYIFEIRALEAVTTRDKILQANKEVVRTEKALVEALHKWDPGTGLGWPGSNFRDTVSLLGDTDTMGQQILAARQAVFVKREVVRQRKMMKAYLKKQRKHATWIRGVLKDVDLAIAVEHKAQLERDELTLRKIAVQMISAGYDTDFNGKPYADYLSGDEHDDTTE